MHRAMEVSTYVLVFFLGCLFVALVAHATPRKVTPAESGARRSCVLAHQVASRISPEGVPQVMLSVIAKADSLADGRIPIPTYPLVMVCTMFDSTRVVPAPREKPSVQKKTAWQN